MKNVILFYALFLCVASFAQNKEDIKILKDKVDATNVKLKNFKTALLAPDSTTIGDSSEIKIYTDASKNIEVIKETYWSGTGKTFIWNYLEGTQPYFVYKEMFIYKSPLTGASFIAGDFTKKEERYYFMNGRIIQWMTDKTLHKGYHTNSAKVENDIMENIDTIIKKFNK